MELRELGGTDLRVSAVGFGASPLGHVFGDVPRDVARAAVRRALDLGVNFFDTSPYYGGTVSESVLGDCLRHAAVPRDRIVVATKCGRYKEGFDFSAARVTRSVDESLARLGLDYVDILHCHDIEFTNLNQIVNETIPALQKIKESGKARFIGITGLPLNIYNYVLDRVPLASVDVILSYCHYGINDTSLVDLLPYLKGKGVGVISASPLAMGLLTDNGPPEWHPATAELKSACRAAVDHCRKKGKSITKLAMQYSLMNNEISTVLVGMSSSEQVEENVAAAMELSTSGIDEELLREVEAILEPVKNLTWPSGIQQA
ncbi:L-galactose dehydrogenase-like [Phragmites australis]|uniref:L-galactose dehydrogenase-like n=1 Tax=Phragmites australis TaxID=29695 RepID=UPI002D7833A9|nr:L-galactose dehydrogenase-like [Phragmites australis]